jgi:O-antigen/teichoic acid export membrane protein
VVILAVVFGRQLLALIGGEEFRQGYAVLIPLTVATCFDLASVAFELVLHSTGRARHALAARFAGLVATVLGIAYFIGDEAATEIAVAVALGGAVSYRTLGVMVMRTLRKLEHLPHPATG